MSKVNLTEAVDNSRFNKFHVALVTLCAFVILFDGYDLAIYGAAVPLIIEEFGISPARAGAIGSYALMGMMVGAIVFGTLSDKVGRKAVIVGCVILYTVFTGAIFFVGSPTELGICRFIAGLGLGGVMPNSIALVAEYSPKNLRSTLVSVMFSGYFVGTIAAALISIGFIPAFGWRSIFLVGLAPLLLIPFLIKFLPESLSFYLKQGRNDEVAATLRKVDPDLHFTGTPEFEVNEGPRQGSSVANLFRDGYAFSTVMLWVAFFMVLLMIYGLLTWLPQLMINAGYPLGSSLSFLLTLCVAGMLITWSGGYLSDRFGARKVLVTAYVVAAVFVALLGFAGNTAVLFIYIAVALGGGATFAAQIFANAFAAQYYPTNARSTGVGWGLGVGRIGAIIGPLLGGILLSANVPLYANFLAFAIPGVIAAVAITLVKDRSAETEPEAKIPEPAKQEA